MKKLLSVILCLCVLGCAVACAEEAGEDTFLLKIWDKSGLEITYLRSAVLIPLVLRGTDLHNSLINSRVRCSTISRAPCSAGDAEELKDLRVVVSCGKSDLAPEDAILEVMKGNPAEEQELLTLDFVPEYGKTYCLDLAADGDGGWKLVPAEA